MAEKQLPSYKKGDTPEQYYKSCIDAGFTDAELDKMFDDEIPASEDGLVTLTTYDGDGPEQ
jgi:hypothetical protein